MCQNRKFWQTGFRDASNNPTRGHQRIWRTCSLALHISPYQQEIDKPYKHYLEIIKKKLQITNLLSFQSKPNTEQHVKNGLIFISNNWPVHLKSNRYVAYVYWNPEVLNVWKKSAKGGKENPTDIVKMSQDLFRVMAPQLVLMSDCENPSMNTKYMSVHQDTLNTWVCINCVSTLKDELSINNFREFKVLIIFLVRINDFYNIHHF